MLTHALAFFALYADAGTQSTAALTLLPAVAAVQMNSFAANNHEDPAAVKPLKARPPSRAARSTVMHETKPQPRAVLMRAARQGRGSPRFHACCRARCCQKRHTHVLHVCSQHPSCCCSMRRTAGPRLGGGLRGGATPVLPAWFCAPSSRV